MVAPASLQLEVVAGARFAAFSEHVIFPQRVRVKPGATGGGVRAEAVRMRTHWTDRHAAETVM